MKLFIYPQHKKGQTSNPYIENLEAATAKTFRIVHKNFKGHLPQELRFLLQSTKADAYVFNWLEGGKGNKYPTFRGITALIGLSVVHLRNAKIVWVFHNIHPHSGENFWSKLIQKCLFRWSTIIVSHSEEASYYARQRAACPVYFKDHPIEPQTFAPFDGIIHDCDYFIWGKIYRYKGIVEFLKSRKNNESDSKVLIYGKCDDAELKKSIELLLDDNVIFENRFAEKEEIAAQCKRSKYVVFPYVGKSISSSGALMDTVLMGGVPVGPHRGSFADLAKEGCCITCNTIDDFFSLPLAEGKTIKLDDSMVKRFIRNNTWNAYGEWLWGLLNDSE